MRNGNKIHECFKPNEPSVSVIIPVWQEESRIRQTVCHVRALSEGSYCEIIVVDGHPEGGTLAAVGDEGVILIKAEKGRGRQMNAGARAASGDILLFLHVDTWLPVDGLFRIRSMMEDKALVGGAFSLRFDSKRFFFRVIERLTFLRARLTRVPYGDQAIFIRRHYFRDIGGYREMPILEDVDLMRRIRKKGDRIAFISTPAVTSSRRWEKKGLLRTTLGNRMIMALYYLGVKPERLSRFYS